MKAPLVTPPKTRISYRFACFMKSSLRGVRFLMRRVLGKEFQYPQWLINYELNCLEWYVDETNAKAEAFREHYPGIRYYEVNIEDLNSPDSVQKMLAYFGFSTDESSINVAKEPTNLMSELKEELGIL